MQITFTLVHAFAMPKIPTKFESEDDEDKAMISSKDDLESVLKSNNVIYLLFCLHFCLLL